MNFGVVSLHRLFCEVIFLEMKLVLRTIIEKCVLNVKIIRQRNTKQIYLNEEYLEILFKPKKLVLCEEIYYIDEGEFVQANDCNDNKLNGKFL